MQYNRNIVKSDAKLAASEAIESVLKQHFDESDIEDARERHGELIDNSIDDMVSFLEDRMYEKEEV